MFEFVVKENISSRLNVFAFAISNGETMLGKLAREDIPRAIAYQFSSNRWTPLSARYAEEKRKKYGSRPILVASGRLIESYHRGGTVSGNTLFYGSDVAYAKYHQSPEARKKLPRRALETDFAANMSRISIGNAIHTARITARL